MEVAVRRVRATSSISDQNCTKRIVFSTLLHTIFVKRKHLCLQQTHPRNLPPQCCSIATLAKLKMGVVKLSTKFLTIINETKGGFTKIKAPHK